LNHLSTTSFIEKTQILEMMKKLITILLVTSLSWTNSFSQNKEIIAILSIDTKNFEYDDESMADLVRIEVEKLNILEVYDKYDMADFVKNNNIQICYGKKCLIQIGKQLNVDYMLTGNLEKLGNKIMFSMRLIDVEAEAVKTANVMEYLIMPEHIQKMVEISVKNIFGKENDPNLVNMLVNYDDPMNTPQTRLKLNGPRMGAAYIMGDLGKRLQDPINKGGWDAFPVMTQFGYQFETQYMSAGNFQGLFEYIIMISGMEQQMFNPSFIFMNGFRSNKTGWEIGFGPSFGITREAQGFYDTDGYMGENNEWYLTSEWTYIDPATNQYTGVYEYYNIESRIDKRGDIKFASGFVFSAGKTFRSGYLNIPVNIYVSPKNSGTYFGASVGFNVNKAGKSRAK
jgi:TolB-like protein